MNGFPIKEGRGPFIKYWRRLKASGLNKNQIRGLLPQQIKYWIDLSIVEPAIDNDEMPSEISSGIDSLYDFFDEWANFENW